MNTNITIKKNQFKQDLETLLKEQTDITKEEKEILLQKADILLEKYNNEFTFSEKLNILDELNLTKRILQKICNSLG